jgi:hypothetical protein
MTDPGFATRFGLAALATWRVTHLLASEDGPADAVVRLRARLGSSSAGALMDCFQCLSMWVAAPLSLAVTRGRRHAVVTWLALSGSACLLERLGHDHATIDEEGAAPDGMLWPETRSTDADAVGVESLDA